MAKVWIERAVNVAPSVLYDVDISFDFGTADFGEVNLWRILSGAHTNSPATAAALTVQEATGNGSPANVGVRWLQKSYRVRASSDAGGRMRIVIGVWGTWETPRTYYIDNVRLLFTRAELSHAASERAVASWGAGGLGHVVPTLPNRPASSRVTFQRPWHWPSP